VNELLSVAVVLVRAEEAWEPVLFGGMIPIVGALAILYIIVRAVRDNPENDDEQEEGGGDAPSTSDPPDPPAGPT
jgi:hypothetical protein